MPNWEILPRKRGNFFYLLSTPTQNIKTNNISLKKWPTDRKAICPVRRDFSNTPKEVSILWSKQNKKKNTKFYKTLFTDLFIYLSEWQRLRQNDDFLGFWGPGKNTTAIHVLQEDYSATYIRIFENCNLQPSNSIHTNDPKEISKSVHKYVCSTTYYRRKKWKYQPCLVCN